MRVCFSFFLSFFLCMCVYIHVCMYDVPFKVRELLEGLLWCWVEETNEKSLMIGQYKYTRGVCIGM